MKIAFYCRKSTADDARISVGRQEQLCRSFAADRWPDSDLEVFADNAVSGATADRPEYQRMLGEIRAGIVTDLVTVEQSRLTRDPAEWERLLVVLDRAGIDKVHAVNGGDIAVGSGDRLLGRIISAVDAEERERAVRRTRDAHATLAAEGRPNGGRPYGYQYVRDGEGRAALEVVPEQAEVVRRIADRALSGTSTGQIARELNADGVPTPRGGTEWSRMSVKGVATSPTIAGHRVHLGVIVGPARWDAIIEPAEWDRVQAALGSPLVTTADGKQLRVKRSRTGRPRSYLLSGGLAVCGKCGAGMSSDLSSRRNGNHVKAYGCRVCNGVTISPAEAVELLVVEAVLTALESTDLRERIAGRDADQSDRADLLAKIADADERMLYASELFGAGELDRESFDQLRKSAKAAGGTARAELDKIGASDAAAAISVDLRERWADLSVAERRRVLDVVIESVTLHPAKPGTRSFDPGRVTIVWR